MNSPQPPKIQQDSDGNEDFLLLDKIYKDPFAAFLHKPQTIEELKDECLIFLDTNALLIPYNTSKESLASFTKIYKRLSGEGRLYLADRVMQEFEKNVPDQIKNIFRSISLGQNYNAPNIEFPLLEGIAEYAALRTAESELKEKIDKFRKAIRDTLEVIENWEHNDPVRTEYRSVFANAKRAKITTVDSENIQKIWSYRLKNKIPPGYKDGGKSDSGIGDYLLWQAVLDTCATEQKGAIVVSSDAKQDWWHKSDSQTLYARRELLEEFRSVTGGLTVRLLSPQDFLKLYGAEISAVQEVELEQHISVKESNEDPTLNESIHKESIISTIKWARKNLKEQASAFGNIIHVLSNSFGITHSFKINPFHNLKDIGKLFPPQKKSEFTSNQSIIIVATSETLANFAFAIAQHRNMLTSGLLIGYYKDGEYNPVYISPSRKHLFKDSES